MTDILLIIIIVMLAYMIHIMKERTASGEKEGKINSKSMIKAFKSRKKSGSFLCTKGLFINRQLPIPHVSSFTPRHLHPPVFYAADTRTKESVQVPEIQLLV